MKLEKISENKLKNDIKKVIRKYLSFENFQIFVFGSRVKGRSHPKSDIDIGILGDQPVDLKTMSKINEEIAELPILYKIEVVDFQTVGKEFRENALKK